MSFAAASQPARTSVALSLVLSVLVHVGAVGGIAAVFSVRSFIAQVAPWLLAKDQAPDADPEAAREAERRARAPQEPEVTWVRPGIDDGAKDSEMWIGYKEATEHAAFQSEIDQSAMTTELPGMRGEADTIAPPAPAAQPSPLGQPLATPVSVTPTPEVPQAPAAEPVAPPAPVAAPPPAAPEAVDQPKPVEATPAPKTAPTDPAPTEAPVVKPAPSEVEAREAEPVEQPIKNDEPAPTDKAQAPPPAPKSEPAKPAETAPQPPPPEKPQPTPTEPAPTTEPRPEATSPAQPGSDKRGSDPKPVPAGEAGEQSEKEADATSIKNAVDYRNGRVRAGEGIDIKTVKPEFSNFTLLTSMPRTPVVEITFTTKGKVKNVRMVQGSGYKDVDEPIINAVWAWTAKGKKLEALAKQQPNGVLKISVRMLL